MRIVLGALAYFAAMFAGAFVFGTVRTLWVEPGLGKGEDRLHRAGWRGELRGKQERAQQHLRGSEGGAYPAVQRAVQLLEGNESRIRAISIRRIVRQVFWALGIGVQPARWQG